MKHRESVPDCGRRLTILEALLISQRIELLDKDFVVFVVY